MGSAGSHREKLAISGPKGEASEETSPVCARVHLGFLSSRTVRRRRLAVGVPNRHTLLKESPVCVCAERGAMWLRMDSGSALDGCGFRSPPSSPASLGSTALSRLTLTSAWSTECGCPWDTVVCREKAPSGLGNLRVWNDFLDRHSTLSPHPRSDRQVHTLNLCSQGAHSLFVLLVPLGLPLLTPGCGAGTLRGARWDLGQKGQERNLSPIALPSCLYRKAHPFNGWLVFFFPPSELRTARDQGLHILFWTSQHPAEPLVP